MLTPPDSGFLRFIDKAQRDEWVRPLRGVQKLLYNAGIGALHDSRQVALCLLKLL